MGINNPVPLNVGAECRKAAKILTSFVKPNQLISYDQVIPPHVLRNAKGLVVLTVLKAGFLFSGRAGSGVIVARLPDGSWSPPSAVMTAGAGVGGQIGAELTDFIFVLNTYDAVKVFSKAGQLTLGGNVSLAAGPLGRNAEAAGAASTGNVAAIFSYSKTKGLFAGVSLEGSVLVERREANRKFYGSNCTARSILSGSVPPPRACEPLFRVLESRAFSWDYDGSDYYGDMPDVSEFDTRSERSSDEDSYYGRRNNNSSSRNRRSRLDDDYVPRRNNNSSRYDPRDDRYERRPGRYDDYDRGNSQRSEHDSGYGSRNASRRYQDDEDWDRDVYSSRRRRSDDSGDVYEATHRRRSTRDAAPPASNSNKAVALYTFAGEQSGDLPFRKGDVITIVQKSGTTDDWWTGEVGGKQGIFPANYVELV